MSSEEGPQLPFLIFLVFRPRAPEAVAKVKEDHLNREAGHLKAGQNHGVVRGQYLCHPRTHREREGQCVFPGASHIKINIFKHPSN